MKRKRTAEEEDKEEKGGNKMIGESKISYSVSLKEKICKGLPHVNCFCLLCQIKVVLG